MAAPPLHQALDHLAFADAKERNTFAREAEILLENPNVARLVQPQNLAALQQIFWRVWTDQSPFQLALQPEAWLLRYFSTFPPLPRGEVALTTFLEIAAMDVPRDILEEALEAGYLDRLRVDRLQAMQLSYPDNIGSLFEFLHYAEDLDDKLRGAGQDVILLLYPSMLSETTAGNLQVFLRDILPFFFRRFAHRFTAEYLLNHTERLTEWFLLWERHFLQAEIDIEPDDAYYAQPFDRIVKYIPEYIWWHNGMIYRNNDKQYYFSSAGFRHLALGGSVRKGPDPRPYTRRMAKYFVTLPADFPHPDWDLYLYFFARNHGAEGMLLELLQEYLRHPEDTEGLQGVMDTWTPVIQKLVAEDFNRLEIYDARQLLGYLYHLLRDQPDYRIQGRSLAQLLQASQEYHRAIEERYRQREAERRARAQAYEQWLKEKIRSWDPHPRVKTYEEQAEKQHRYRITELLTETALSQEGAVMRHCVGTYADLCKTNMHSVWSLREFKKSRWYSLVTIHLVNNTIAEVRGPFNAKPTKEHREIIERWAEREHLQWRGFG